ncbi:sensor histidine kinase [Falsirhodobacter sp. 20TX0035]|uniref:sensor histidine kinase n=1 Tax=Falsirhodobacter sp. 20TX0035 TaxID=3022019 RepID=UPI00232F94EF|nr:ATP-binding protein [Falsirhodobacter sp. 20TX0035]MDB6453181.1 ATP-binding protein [Falsirhodobacter sp. 20TX0035]
MDILVSAEGRLLGSLVDGIPAPALVIAQDERISFANAAALALFGGGIVGRHYIIAMRQPGLLDAIEGTLRHKQKACTRYIVAGPSREIAFQVTVSPVEGNRALCVFEDVSEQEQVSAMRRDFVANVSHELRTPLTSLLGFIETLQGAAKDDAAARDRFLGIMSREAERMNRLVRDLLSLSRVESEERMRPTTPVDMVALVAVAMAALRPVAAAKGVRLEQGGQAGPLPVPADADQMTQVFQNLIENAVKYGASGGVVHITVERDDSDALRLGPAVVIRVTDKGDGIDPIHIPRLTERFYRVDDHRSREMGGTGLGLAIVKHIINRHRGRFRIESAKGQGSTFSVFLPVA